MASSASRKGLNTTPVGHPSWAQGGKDRHALSGKDEAERRVHRLDPVRDRHADLMPPEQRRCQRSLPDPRLARADFISGRPPQLFHRHGRRARQLASRPAWPASIRCFPIVETSISLWRMAGMHSATVHAVIQQPCLARRCAQFDELQIDLGKDLRSSGTSSRQHGVGRREHVNRPDNLPGVPAATARACLRNASAVSALALHARAQQARPAAVSSIPRAPRRNSGVPTSDSSLRIWTDSGGCAMRRRTAAPGQRCVLPRRQRNTGDAGGPFLPYRNRMGQVVRWYWT